MRKWIPILLGFLLVVFTIWVMLTSEPRKIVRRIDNLAYDLQLEAHIFTHQHALKENWVAIVDIDDKSLKAIGHWPWPRNILAALVDKLQAQGAVIIALDVLFPEAENNAATLVLQELQQQKLLTPTITSLLNQTKPHFDNDAIFANALAKTSAVLGMTFTFQSQTTGALPPPLLTLSAEDSQQLQLIIANGYLSDIPILMQAAKYTGFLNVFPDRDGIIRRAPLVMEYQQGIYPSLALEAARLYLGQDIQLVTPLYDKTKQLEGIQFGQNIIPTDEDGQVLIPFIGKSYTFPYISAIDVLHDKVPADAFTGKIVFIGSSATGLGDLKATAIGTPYPGVEIQASLVQGILTNSFSYQPAWAFGAILVLVIVLGSVASVFFPFLGPRILCILILCIPPILFFIANSIWAATGLILSPLIPTFLLLAIAILNTLYGYLFESRRREYLKSMFGQYVPAKHIDEMLKHPGKDSLRGEDKEMTVLFADIRSFTTLSEGLTAAELKAMLNAFFTPMTEIIFKHQGTIDKYVGDMIMAFWGAPLTDRQHAQHAIMAALDMQHKVKELEPIFKEKQWPEVHIGIGLNSGIMSVGDMGSQFRRNYTVLGDAVNLGSRVEGLTKYYGAHIIATETTQKNQSQFTFQLLDRVRVKGKKLGIHIYEPLCLATAATLELTQELALHEKALQYYFQQAWKQAELLFQQLQAKNPQRKLYPLYLERIAHFQQTPPPTDWDGIYTHTTK